MDGSQLLREVTSKLSQTDRAAGIQKRQRTILMDTAGDLDRTEKKQMVERMQLPEVEEVQVDDELERGAAETLAKVMKETRPSGWPAGLSTVAVSSVGVSPLVASYMGRTACESKADQIRGVLCRKHKATTIAIHSILPRSSHSISLESSPASPSQRCASLRRLEVSLFHSSLKSCR